LGVGIDLIDPGKYISSSKAIDPKDLALLSDTLLTEESSFQQKVKRPTVTWLRKTEYIANTPISAGNTQSGSSQTEGEKPRRDQDDDHLMNKIQNIEESFKAAKSAPKHPHDRTLKPVEVLPVFPDFELWANVYSEVVFDTDPAPTKHKIHRDLTQSEEVELVSEAIIKGFNKAGIPCVAYFTPRQRKTSAETNDNKVEYNWIREYHYNVKKDKDFKDSYFVLFRDNKVTYTPITSRVNLHKMTKTKQEEEEALSGVILTKSHEVPESEIQERKERMQIFEEDEDFI